MTCSVLHAQTYFWNTQNGLPMMSTVPYVGMGNIDEGYFRLDKYGRYLAVEDSAFSWDDIRIVPGAFKFAGAADPSLQNWQPGGSGATLKVYKFKNNDEAFVSCQIPHSYAQGENIRVHVHWSPCDRGNEESGSYVGWKADITWANISGVFASTTTYDLSDMCTGTDDYHEITADVEMSGAGKSISSMLMCRIYRSDTGADDTWVGTLNAQSPALLEMDFHFPKDAYGSRWNLVK